MADPKITANRGWHQLSTALGKTIPAKLHSSQRARLGLRQLMRGKGH